MIGEMHTPPPTEIQREMLVRRDIVEAFDLQRRIARIIKLQRRRRRITRRKFAGLLNLSLEEITSYETASAGVPMCILYQMAQYLDWRFQFQIQTLEIELSFLITSDLPKRMVLH